MWEKLAPKVLSYLSSDRLGFIVTSALFQSVCDVVWLLWRVFYFYFVYICEDVSVRTLALFPCTYGG